MEEAISNSTMSQEPTANELFRRTVKEDSARLSDETRMVTAYAKNGGEDTQRILVPEGYTFLNHFSRITTANPSPDEVDGEWTLNINFIRSPADPSRIIEVVAFVSAETPPLFGASRWIGVELTVVLRRL
jgi:hypothetical protein